MQKSKIFEQQENESSKAFSAFRIYCDMGPERTVEPVASKCQKGISLIRKWAHKFQWSKRAKAFDAHLLHIAYEAEEKALKKSAGTWAARMANVREKDWQMAQKIRARAERVLKAKETKSTFGDAVRALKIASDLERLACNMTTGKTEITGADNTPLIQPSPYNPVIILPCDGCDDPEKQVQFILPDDGRDRPAPVAPNEN